MNSSNEGRLPPCLHDIALRLTPSSKERLHVDKIAERVRREAEEAARKLYGKKVVLVEYEGSYAKDTWLSGELDLDLFVFFSEDFELKSFEEAIKKIAFRAAERLNAKLERRYAAHPYYTLILDSLNVDLVPAYYVEDVENIKTPVDRTRFHTLYVKKELSRKPYLKQDIRLLKKLLKLLWIYGAEIEVQGFSGYLTEILVIRHGGLLPLLEKAATWRPWKTAIPPSTKSEFKAPLIVLDPVDPQRNAAAAVSEESLAKFIALSVLSSSAPERLCCIYRSLGRIKESFEEKPRKLEFFIVSISLKKNNASPQEIAGITQKHRVKIVRNAEKHGFQIARSKVFLCDNKSIIVFEVINPVLHPFSLHRGPPVYSPHSAEFISKWRGHPLMIRDSRWYTVIDTTPRYFMDVVENTLNSDRRIKWARLTLEELPAKCPKAYQWLTQGEKWAYCLVTQEKN